MNEKIEDTVHQRMMEMNLQTQLSGVAATEMKLRELLDAQGKDIAEDMAKIEADIHNLDNRCQSQISAQM